MPGRRSPASSCSPSTRIGVPFTSTWRTPVGFLGGEPLGVGREVAHAAGRPGADGRRVEHAHVGPVAFAHVAAAVEAEHVGRFAGQLAYGVLERHDRSFAHPGAEQVGGQRRVAQLVDVRAGVGQAERDVLVGEQMRDRVDLVVGDVRTEAGVEVLRRAPARTSRRAGCVPRSRARSLTRRPCSSGKRADSDTSNVSQRGFIGESSRSAAAAARHAGIAVRREPHRAARPSSTPRTPCPC